MVQTAVCVTKTHLANIKSWYDWSIHPFGVSASGRYLHILFSPAKLRRVFKYLTIRDIHSFSSYFPALPRCNKISRNIIYFAVRTSEQWYDNTSKRYIILPPACTKDDKKEQYIFITIYCHDKLLSIQQIVRTWNRPFGLSPEPYAVRANCLLMTLNNERISKHQIDK